MYLEGVPNFTKNQSGFGKACRDILMSLSYRNDLNLEVITQSSLTKKFTLNRITFLKRTIADILFNVRFKDVFYTLSHIFQGHYPFSRVIKITLYNFSLGHFIKVLNTGRYDIIHVNGISYYTYGIIEYLLNSDQRFVLTLHGLNSLEKDIEATAYERVKEKVLIQKLLGRNIPITVVSSGVKKKIHSYFGLGKIFVTPNPVSNAYQKGALSTFAKNILCVGNYSRNKNQLEVLTTFLELSKEFQAKYRLNFFGADSQDRTLQRTVERVSHPNVIYHGDCLESTLQSYYSRACLVVSASKSEGFGLPFIEGFSYGIPAVFYDDLDITDDISSESCTVVAERGLKGSLAKAIIVALTKPWDHQLIQQKAEKFFNTGISDNYTDVYSNSLK